MIAPRSRSIPACAGEPGLGLAIWLHLQVYPRVCGGTVVDWLRLSKGSGLSPRVRGNPGAARADDLRRRSIPACAGEPFGKWVALLGYMVYPRVCGGTITFG